MWKLSFRRKSNTNRYESGTILKSYFFAIALICALAFLIYMRGVAQEVRKEARRLSKLIVNLHAVAVSKVAENDAQMEVIFNEVLQKTNLPMVLTSVRGDPQAWKGIGIDLYDSSTTAQRKIRAIIKKMDKQNRPIPVELKEAGGIIGYLHYGDTLLIRQLSWFPILEIFVIALFITAGFMVFRNIKNSEERYMWVGMAKESAHQFGTPVSSLFGWLELMKAEIETKYDGSESYDRLKDILEDMGNDVVHLSKIASRFGLIGSIPELKMQNVKTIMSDTVSYFRDRLPHLGQGIEIQENYDRLPDVLANRELLGWAFENLIRNSIDAMEKNKRKPIISITATQNSKYIVVNCSDNGRGMTLKEQKKIFLPGYTTKQRGWGLGLTFVKRIIEDYHNGKIYVKRSESGRGTTMEIFLPIKRKEGGLLKRFLNKEKYEDYRTDTYDTNHQREKRSSIKDEVPTVK